MFAVDALHEELSNSSQRIAHTLRGTPESGGYVMNGAAFGVADLNQFSVFRFECCQAIAEVSKSLAFGTPIGFGQRLRLCQQIHEVVAKLQATAGVGAAVGKHFEMSRL